MNNRFTHVMLAALCATIDACIVSSLMQVYGVKRWVGLLLAKSALSFSVVVMIRQCLDVAGGTYCATCFIVVWFIVGVLVAVTAAYADSISIVKCTVVILSCRAVDVLAYLILAALHRRCVPTFANQDRVARTCRLRDALKLQDARGEDRSIVSCSVCIGALSSTTRIAEFYCHHVAHASCAEKWLSAPLRHHHADIRRCPMHCP
eukprot:TRINITY_DN75981_c0_g1_i1.p1 TRINITY_DN75981_c0_g1~~TRINITY_DN75981_c0_g1_i1.p1  ORF type:complete len:218 (+),score=10.21 TRINITY_DN75981_c0_g1_i1:42-656(+)